VPGELYVAGIGLAAGYFRDPETTRAKFLTHPRTGERIYRTGDWGRYLPSGDIEFLGREDLQVKLQGQRIELGEIEAALAQSPEVEACAVVAAAQGSLQRLVAFVVLRQPARLDALERIDFKLARHGLRRDLATQAQLDLPGDPASLDVYARRRSSRRFLSRQVPLAAIGRLLACLRPVAIPGSPLEKRLYPSAGGLYPIDLYLHLHSGRVSDSNGATYRYDPRRHALIPIRCDRALSRSNHDVVNREIFDTAAFSLFLVARLKAVVPSYGERARELCLIEAGAIGQLFLSEARHQSLGLCPIGKLDIAAVADLLRLSAEEILVHSFLGGPVEGGHSPSTLLQELATAAQSSAARDGRVQALVTDLSLRLPQFMVPAEVVELERLPLTANGKVDRLELARKAAAARQEPAGAPWLPTELERTVVAAWREVLGIEDIGRDRPFFELGGNSLHLVQISLRLSRDLGREVSIGDLFRHPTIGALAAHLGSPAAAGSLAGLDVRAQQARQALRSARPGRVNDV
jgi:epothilone synthetase B